MSMPLLKQTPQLAFRVLPMQAFVEALSDCAIAVERTTLVTGARVANLYAPGRSD